ncbi:MAG: GntR family transcriptional regulator [Clostridiales bacterium]|nr:GntR family transcriptional regulator [Clostridiales bacterium]MCF8023025.1 GntR family transcriptional regulator [Clostridiales bacterium]
MFKIDQRSSIPIYQQLIQEIKQAILKGILQPGDKLPSVRELSVQLTINPNTIQKSYQELEKQKIIETLRGKGTFVTTHYKPGEDKEKLDRLKENLRNTLVETYYLGLNKDEIMQLVQQLLEELKIGEGKS